MAISIENKLPSGNNDLVTTISNFVDQIQIEWSNSNIEAEPLRVSVAQDEPVRVEAGSPEVPCIQSTVNAPGYEEAHRRMENVVVEAEKFKVAVKRPPGMNTSPFMVSSQINVNPDAHCLIGDGVTDDDFFHLTCHVSANLKEQIKLGEYVDLDKLLPKDNIFPSRTVASNETKLEWVQSEGSTYLVPAKSVSHINCFCRWEQAFRVYATIYCTQNPERSHEVWQYMSVINTASMSYNWDNIYNYDMVFRQLMEFNTKRSWAVTYNRMWNLSMTNPLVNNHGHNQAQRRYSNPGGSFNQQGQKRKIDYCWSFNKGLRCKFGKKCKFIERCSYCDAASHGVVNCDKLDKKDKDNYVRGGSGDRKKSH